MDIKHDLAGQQFIMTDSQQNKIGYIAYRVESNGNLSALSVHVSSQWQGQGAAGKLLNSLVEYARTHGLKIFPVCPYVVKKFEQDPLRYADVIGGRSS